MTPLRILLLGDASNYHHALAGGLRRLGHDVTVASDGSRWMDTGRDIDLSRRPGPIGGASLYGRLRFDMRKEFTGYDIVQLSGPFFTTLRPHRLAAVYRSLCSRNRAVFVDALGTDTIYIDACMAKDSPLHYSEFAIAGEPTAYAATEAAGIDAWHGPGMAELCKLVYGTSRGIVTALYEYHAVMSRAFTDRPIAYGGIPIDLRTIAPRPLSVDGPVRVLAAVHSQRMAEKGIDRLLAMVSAISADHPGCLQLTTATDMPYADFVEALAQADVVLDQLYSYTPATTALLAMAMGRVTVSGGEDDYYNFIGERELRPVINPDPTDDRLTRQRLECALLDRGALSLLSQQGRLLVERDNADVEVASRFVDFWTKHM